MIIGIDLLAINKSRNHGIGNFAEKFCKSLMENHEENQYVLLNWSNVFLGDDLFSGVKRYKEVCVGICKRTDVDKARNAIKEFVRENNVELYLDMSPLWGERPMLQHEWFGDGCQLTGIVYDFIPYAMRDEEYYNNRTGFLEYLEKMFNLHQYDHLFPISNYTKNDAHDLAKIDKDKMTVIYCSAGEYKKDNSKEKFNCIKDKLRMRDKYFLYPAGDAPHKNIIRLILAYAIAKKEYNNLPQLVITGKYGSNSLGTFHRIINYHGLNNTVLMNITVDGSIAICSPEPPTRSIQEIIICS